MKKDVLALVFAIVHLALAGTVPARAESRTPFEKRFGSISGTVTTTTGEPLADVRVSLFNASGTAIALRNTSPRGRFVFRGNLAGTYYLTAARAGFVTALHEGTACAFHCDVTSGTALTIEEDLDAVIRIALTRTGSISGVVTAADTGEPLAGATVAMDAGRLALSGPDGTFEMADVPPGIFTVRATAERAGFLDARVDGVLVGPGADTAGVDFQLVRGGTLSGRVSDATTGEALAFASVSALLGGAVVASATAGFDGTYRIAALTAGDYTVVADARGRRPEAFEEASCDEEPCVYASATLLTVGAGQDVTGVDFTLASGAGIAGTVVDEATGEPLPASVSLYREDGSLVGFSSTDIDGAYRIDGLAPGIYRLGASGSLHVDELYGGQPCELLECDLSSGTTVEVLADSLTSDVSFALARAGSVSGTVSAVTGQPLPAVNVAVFQGTRLISGSFTDANGDFRADGLAPGLYHVRTSTSGRYLDQVNGAHPCPHACDFSAIEPVAIELGGETTGVDFELAEGSELSGRVFDEQTGHRLPRVMVHLFDRYGLPLTFTFSNERGVYRFTGLAAGAYRVAVYGAYGYVGESYGGAACPYELCDVTAGSPVRIGVSSHRARVDLRLIRGGTVKGTVTDAGSGQPLGGVEVAAHACSGDLLTRALSDQNGHYRIRGIPLGLFFFTVSAGGYVAEETGAAGSDFGCEVESGRPIAVPGGATVEGVDFVLRPSS